MAGTLEPVDASADTRLSLSGGQMIDHYRLMRRLGRGGMGEVFLARDTRLGRKAALKLIRPDALGDAESVARFLFEAQVTARFSHPHIVTVYGVGELDGRPYVALEYLEGENLRERTLDTPLSAAETMRTGLAIAEALREAHDHQVLHRDLKPENVLLPKDGRPRVVDFGLAKALTVDLTEARPDGDAASRFTTELDLFQSTGNRLAGTPLYMAPEQWARAEASPATDIWALGVILYELLCDHPPYEELDVLGLGLAVRSEGPVPPLDPMEPVPERLEALVLRCLEKDPASRPNAAEVVEVLRALLRREPAGGKREGNPFRGLLPFTERQADLFFGRDAEVAAFLERLRSQAVLPVVGASGAGKSSFVSAGVVPRLREQGRWLVLALRPGRAPLRALSSCLARGESGTTSGPSGSRPSDRRRGSTPRPVAAQAVDEIHDLLTASPKRLAWRLQRLAEEEQTSVLLFVDQLEEVFTLVDDREQRHQFLAALAAAADDPATPVRVIFALRDDFLGRLAEDESARDVLHGVTVVACPRPRALAEILRKPVEAVGYTFEDDALVEEMVASVRDEPAALPLLQFAGHALWERRDRKGRELLRSAYEDIGGVEGALASQADRVLDSLTPKQVAVARQIFLRLVTPEGTRRVLPRVDLLDGLPSEAEAVLDRWLEERALVSRKGRGEGGAEAEVELVHESLIGTWGRLSRWIDEAKEELVFLDEVGQAAELWERRGRPADEVWRGSALWEADRALARTTTEVPAVVAEFLAAGHRLEAQVARRRRRRVGVGFGVLFLVAAAAMSAALALSAKNREVEHERAAAEAGRQEAVLMRQAAEEGQAEAETQRAHAEAQRAEAQREAARGAMDRGDLVEARGRLRLSLESADTLEARGLWAQLSREPLQWETDLCSNVPVAARFLSGTGELLLACDSEVRFLDPATGEIREAVILETSRVADVTESADRGRVVVLPSEGPVRMYQAGAEEYRSLAVDAEPRFGPLALHPDERRLVAGTPDGSLSVWDIETDTEIDRIPGLGPLFQIAFTPDGQRLVGLGRQGDVIALWQLSPWSEVWRVAASDVFFTGLEVDPAARFVVHGTTDNRVVVRDLADGREVTTFRDEGPVYATALGPEGRWVAAGGVGRAARLWDLETGAELRRLPGHRQPISWVAVSADRRWLFSASNDTQRVWSLNAPPADPPRPLHRDIALAVAADASGERLATGGLDGRIGIWDATTGAFERFLDGHTNWVLSLDFGPDGRLASAGYDDTVRIWDLETGSVRVVEPIRVPVGGNGLQFSADGHYLVIRDETAIVVLDAESGRRVRTVDAPPTLAGALDLSPDGSLVVSGDRDGRILLWRLDSGEPVSRLATHESPLVSTVFTPDGERIVSVGLDGEIRVTETATGASRVVGNRGEGLQQDSLSVHPDGTRVAACTTERLAATWALEGGEPTTFPRLNDNCERVTFDTRGRLLAMVGALAGVPTVIDVETGQLVRRAPGLLRDPPEVLTHGGWQPLGLDLTATPSGVVTTSWRTALADDAVLFAAAGRDRACVLTRDGRVESWDLGSDRRLASHSFDGTVYELAPLGDGCAVRLRAGQVEYFEGTGPSVQLTADATAMARVDDPQALGPRLLVARDVEGRSEVVAFDHGGNVVWSRPVEGGVTALAASAGTLVVSTGDYHTVRLLSLDEAGSRWRSIELERLRPTATIALALGPQDTLVVGFANGFVGIWETSAGRFLDGFQMHGMVRELLVDGDALYAVTGLGDVWVRDLSWITASECQLLDRVWADVPFVWADGRARRAPPPPEHRCAPLAP